MSETRRTYQMTRVESGDYLCPSNDGRKIWRFRRYREDGSLERGDGSRVVGEFWSASVYNGTVEQAETALQRDPEAFLFLWEGWLEQACLLSSRKEAVEFMHREQERREHVADTSAV